MPECYLCGCETDLTRDHIPPRGFFPPPRPDNLITMPCCRACNDSYKLDDEAFRVLVTAPPDISSAGQWIQEHRVFAKTFANSPKLAASVAASIRPDPDGSGMVLSMPRERGNRFLIRLTKGLLAYFYPNFPRESQEFEIRNFTRVDAEVLAKLAFVRDQMKYDERGVGVFQFRHDVTNTPRQQFGFWLYCFYESSLFGVYHSRR